MPSHVYQYVTSLVVSLPIRRGPGVFKNVSVLQHRALKSIFFDVAKFTILTILSLNYPDVDSHSQLSASKYSLSQLLH
jgi:hypothetical protein